jgi:hypothetical protein
MTEARRLLRRSAAVLPLLLALLAGCGGGDSRQDPRYVLDEYQDTSNPLDNLDYCFRKATEILGDGVALVRLTGEQRDRVPRTSFETLDWYWVYSKGTEELLFDVRERRIHHRSGIEPAAGYELIYAGEARTSGLAPIRDVWESVVQAQSKPLLTTEIMIPLFSTPLDAQYRFFTREGLCDYGVDYFPYDARTGEPL